MDRRLGVLAFGDSITNGGGELQWGVALQSWALWTARGLGLPYTGCAVDGATAAHVVGRADPALRARSPRAPDARYDVGCLYVGRQRRARARRGTPAAYERDLRAALAFLRERCDRVLPARSRSTSAGRAPARGGRGERGDRARRGERARSSSTCATSARATA